MKKTTSLLCAVAALMAFSACQGEQPSGDEETPGTATESPAGPQYDPAALLSVSFTPPAEVVENAEVPFTSLLPYETYETSSYDIDLPDIGAENRIFVTQYLLPADGDYSEYDAQLAVVREYDALVVNTADEDSHDPALVAGNSAVWRFTIIENGESKTYQQNYFVFVENHLVQITCQWTNRRDFVRPACAEFQQTLAIQQ
ncbi:hypothetical protein AB0B28_04155 [Glycomyces sp. NPDC046736]|uniref:hypothetical protein n=1 Tax=Glycomyces sp. NPDC046736 TaxID=3155615 RepID=UPI0033C62737